MRTLVYGLVLMAVAACATSPLGRSQLALMPPGQLDQMGLEAFQQVKRTTPEVTDPRVSRYVQCVSDAITQQVGGTGTWQVEVFRDSAVNAFALPGGRIGVYTGLLQVAETPDQLAAVIGHEVAHVVAQHHNERVSQQFATEQGLALASALAGGGATQQSLMALLGLGAQVGVLLPYSRIQETEADKIGLDLMAQAGFDPRAAVELWRNMERDGGGPEFLSTHPSGGTRIEELQGRMDHAMDLYQQARSSGRGPRCGRPR
jgi:predicted Zn-dependent protease